MARKKKRRRRKRRFVDIRFLIDMPSGVNVYLLIR